MPDRLRAAFNPTRLGGDLAGCRVCCYRLDHKKPDKRSIYKST